MARVRLLTHLGMVTVWCATTTVAPAAVTTFTSRTAFEASLPTGYFFDDFTDLPNLNVQSVTRTGGSPSISYSCTAPPNGVFSQKPPFVSVPLIGNWSIRDDFVVTFNTGNVYSAGGEIWFSDENYVRLSGTATVTFSNGSTMLVPSGTSGPLSFAGITSTEPLTSMTVSRDLVAYINLSNFYTAVPEPSACGMALAGLACGYSLWRRCKRV